MHPTLHIISAILLILVFHEFVNLLLMFTRLPDSDDEG